MKRVLCVVFLLISHVSFSQVILFDEEEKKNFEECLNLHEFVMDNFVKLVRDVYVGDEPFFIIVQHIYNTPDIMQNNIEFTFTQNYQTLLDYEFALFYKYEKRDDVYIILNRFDSNKLKVFFAKTYNVAVVNSSILKNTFYPLSVEHKFLSMPKYSDKGLEDCYVYTWPWYGVISNDDGVKALENTVRINYFTNYKRKYFSNPKFQKQR